MQVTFVGLGTMGRPMSGHLARHVPVAAADADPAAVAAVTGTPGITALADPLDGAGADVVVLMLPDSPAVQALMGSPEDPAGFSGRLREGAVVVDMGSSNPEETRRLATDLRRRGVALVDAPVSGGPRKAVSAELTIMVGGDEADVARVTPLLSTMGASITHVGDVGAAHALKSLNNLLSAIGLVGALEVLTTGARFGLDPRVMLDVINRSTGRNQSTEVKLLPGVVEARHDVGFSLGLTVKDITTALDLGIGMGLDGEVSRACVKVCREALDHLGDPGADQSEIARYLADRSGVDLAEPRPG